jgi:hypothetical protein
MRWIRALLLSPRRHSATDLSGFWIRRKGEARQTRAPRPARRPERASGSAGRDACIWIKRAGCGDATRARCAARQRTGALRDATPPGEQAVGPTSRVGALLERNARPAWALCRVRLGVPSRRAQPKIASAKLGSRYAEGDEKRRTKRPDYLLDGDAGDVSVGQTHGSPRATSEGGPSVPLETRAQTRFSPRRLGSVIGRSPWCSRRLGDGPRALAPDRRGGRGSRRRSRGRSPFRRRASSSPA